MQVFSIYHYQLRSSLLTQINELTNPNIYRAHQQTCRSSKKKQAKGNTFSIISLTYIPSMKVGYT